MPLLSGSSNATVGKNIAELEHAGHKRSQSIAIALQKAGKSNKDEDLGDIPSNSTVPEVVPIRSSREYDENDWPEIPGNPISKVGVFPYAGSQIDPNGDMGLDPQKIYMIYRPESELSDEETIKSFRLLPFTDEHAMLGSSADGLTPAEEKGVHGVIGQDVYFDAGYLKGNLKIFSEEVNDLIKSGKKELSIGYRCMYDMQSGIFDSQPYDGIQRNIRGNHIALVEEGRSGPDVSVLDKLKFTFDSKDLKMPDMSKPGEGKPEDLDKPEGKDNMNTEMEKENMSKDNAMNVRAICNSLRDVLGYLEKMEMKEDGEDVDWNKEDMTGDVEPKEFVKKADITDIAESEAKEAEGEKKEDEKVDKEVEKEAHQKNAKVMDTKALLRQISQRDALAARLSKHIGTFDHKEMTPEEVAAYGVKKLGLTCKKGHEESVLVGYLAAAKSSPVASLGMDSASPSSQIDAYLGA